MPKIAYKPVSMRLNGLSLVETCNEIITEYQADWLLLTLRQLYYQLVSRGVIANQTTEYNRLGNIVSDARLQGLMDWDAIEDRTRELVTTSHWGSPADILETCARQFRVDRWKEQDVHPEVWIEKEALSGVFERICRSLDVGCFACRGYTSQSAMWGAGQRFIQKIQEGQRVVVFHFGDHDPSGIDMTRDIEDRIRMFARHDVGPKADSHIEIKRLALNMDQVRKYNPPENPAKTTDSRFTSYAAAFGGKSWELDALNPRTLSALVRDNVMSVCDKSLWEDIITAEATARGELRAIQVNYDEVIGTMRQDGDLNLAIDEHVEDARIEIREELGEGDDSGDDGDEN